MLAYDSVNALDERPKTNSIYPACTGTSVVALTYKDGVAIATDTRIGYGSTARYFNFQRQLVLNPFCIIAFSGDVADFQFIQLYIQSEQEDYRSRIGDPNANLKPKMVHSFLTSYLYYRRSKMDPLWNTLVVVGKEPVDLRAGEFKPFLGVIQKHGTAYEVPSVGTGLAAMTLNQLIETELASGEMTREKALNVIKKCMEHSFYRDTASSQDYTVSFIEKDSSELLKAEKVVGNWELAEENNQYF